MQKSTPLRVGLLGCGRIAGFFHAPLLESDPNVALVAIADADTAARDRVGAAISGAIRFADWRRAIDVAALDAVVICLPPSLHAAAAIAALERGLHVYVEKPMALGVEEADGMVRAQRAGAAVAMVGFNFRFHPLYGDLRRRLQAGELGKVQAIRTLFTSTRRQLPGWKGVAGSGGSALSDLATHHFDLVPYLTGQGIDANTLQAMQTLTGSGSLTTVDARLEDGCHLQMVAGQTTGHSAHRVELLAENGHLTVDLSDTAPRPLLTPPGRLARVRRLTERLAALGPRELLHAPGRDPSFRRALQTFVDVCRGEERSYPDLEDGRRVVRLVERAERSAADPAADPLRQTA